jgi:hypothetical protein
MLLLIGACAGKQPGMDTESSLKARVNAYWQHKIKGEFAEAYLLESSVIREKVSLTDYIQASAGGTIWMNAIIKSVAIEGASATVYVEITYALMGIYCPKKGLTRTIRHYWHLDDGIWYHRPKPSKKNKKV